MMEPRVKILREFRDRFLLTNGAGRAFVKFYYRHSPALAAPIAESELLKSLTRILLMPVYNVLHTTPIQVMFIFLVLMAASGGWLLVRKRRKGTTGLSWMPQRGGKNIKLAMIVALLAVALVCGPGRAGFAAGSAQGGKEAQRGKFSVKLGAGYNYVNEEVRATMNSRTSVFEVDYSLYPVVRLGYRLNDRVAIETGFHFDYYQWKIKSSLSDDTSHFFGYSFVVGPLFYDRERDLGFLGRGTLFSQAGIGCKFLYDDLNFPIEDYSPALGGEIAVGLEKGTFDFRIGYALFKHHTNGTASGFSTDESNDRLDLSGFFCDITYNFGR